MIVTTLELVFLVRSLSYPDSSVDRLRGKVTPAGLETALPAAPLPGPSALSPAAASCAPPVVTASAFPRFLFFSFF